MGAPETVEEAAGFPSTCPLVRNYSAIVEASAPSTPSISDESPLLPSPSYSTDDLLNAAEHPVVLPKSKLGRVILFLRGPRPPRPSHVSLLYAPIQVLPLKIGRSMRKRSRITAIVLYLCAWFLIFVFLSHKSKFSPVTSSEESIELLECNNNPLWMTHPYNACGLNAKRCEPFDANTTLTFRCPSSCAGAAMYSMTTVGKDNVIYKPYVIGDKNGYRADSFVCAAAVHAGVVSQLNGGCGRVIFNGARDTFPSSTENGVETIGFPSYFPASYVFDSSVTSENCYDLRWAITGVNIALSAIFAYFVYSPSVFFWGMFMMGFWSIVLATDPPPTNKFPDPGAEAVSVAFQRLLPTAFIGYVILNVAIKPTLTNVRAQLTKTVLWVGAFWVGALNNYTFDELPLDRFVAEDIKNLPGGIAAITFVLLAIFLGACGQAYVIWKNAKFFPYLAAYAIVFTTLIVMAFVPNETLRIHHYILGLLILPATAFQTTMSLLYQGLAVGMFLNGSTRWGYDSILQTEYQLNRGGPRNTDLAHFTTNSTNFNGSLVAWDYPSHPRSNWTGFSLLINDVERYRGPMMNISLDNFYYYNDLEYQRYDYDWFFRVAMYSDEGDMSDYTKPAIARAHNGSWVPPHSGPS
ncbi:uncharacterized protein V1518DRAFT_418570 [Limtongia smithiae]|uniref:uncharacterized protein n=1 Tax=Limtongia smithiae TaxID=1125753 RepID=UPI0034CF1D5E